MCDYTDYTTCIEKLLKDNNISNFKSIPQYCHVLEHVMHHDGEQYLYYIRNAGMPNHVISSYCALNDKIGSPIKSRYNDLVCSPTSLRYLLHAHLILTHLQKLNMPTLDIIEVGCGYGGLCLALHHLADRYNVKIDSYTLCDLPIASKLQQKYIREVNPDINVNYIDSTNFGADIPLTNMFLISNYCFSELPDNLQESYIKCLFPKVIHGFMAWNRISLYNFGFKLTIEDEYPKTGGMNKYVYF